MNSALVGAVGGFLGALVVSWLLGRLGVTPPVAELLARRRGGDPVDYRRLGGFVTLVAGSVAGAVFAPLVRTLAVDGSGALSALVGAGVGYTVVLSSLWFVAFGDKRGLVLTLLHAPYGIVLGGCVWLVPQVVAWVGAI